MIDTKVTAFTVTTDGSLHPLRMDDAVLSLAEMQEAVGGYIERVSFFEEEGFHAYANEEGLLRQLLPNPTASAICGRSLVGDVLFCKKELVQ